VYPTKRELCTALGDEIIADITQTLTQQARYHLVLSGGSTPKTLYAYLATQHAHSVPWERVSFYWGDERFVPHDHEQSNTRMARESFLDALGVTAQNSHPFPTHEATPDAAAQALEATLKTIFPDAAWPRFDRVLLGMGTDGHTASLFPGTDACLETRRWVTPSTAPAAPTQRLTLTFPAINHARHIDFLLTGSAKGPVLSTQLSQPTSPNERPTGAIQPRDGTLLYWLDQDAAEPFSRD
jgi:6-phosphogluconolactonase